MPVSPRPLAGVVPSPVPVSQRVTEGAAFLRVCDREEGQGTVGALLDPHITGNQGGLYMLIKQYFRRMLHVQKYDFQL